MWCHHTSMFAERKTSFPVCSFFPLFFFFMDLHQRKCARGFFNTFTVQHAQSTKQILDQDFDKRHDIVFIHRHELTLN